MYTAKDIVKYIKREGFFTLKMKYIKFLVKETLSKIKVESFEDISTVLLSILQKYFFSNYDYEEDNLKELELEILKAINFNITPYSKKEIKIYDYKDIKNRSSQKKEGKYGIVQQFKLNKNMVVKWHKNNCIDSDFLREISILKSVDHPNIVNIHGIVLGKRIGIVLEKLRYEMGILENVSFYKEIKKTLIYLHRRNIYHCDIHLFNIMVSSDMKPKLIDFGMSIHTQERAKEQLKHDLESLENIL